MPGTFTETQFRRWNAAIAKTRPGAATDEEIANAKLVTGLALQGVGDGIVLRLSDDSGTTQTFRINAAIALRIVDTVQAAGLVKGWLNPDGTVSSLPG